MGMPSLQEGIHSLADTVVDVDKLQVFAMLEHRELLQDNLNYI
jgi:hypothetical protein